MTLQLGPEPLPGVSLEAGIAAARGVAFAFRPVAPVQAVVPVGRLVAHLFQLNKQNPAPFTDIPAGWADTDGGGLGCFQGAHPDHGPALFNGEIALAGHSGSCFRPAVRDRMVYIQIRIRKSIA
jgi:hypothetical protein